MVKLYFFTFFFFLFSSIGFSQEKNDSISLKSHPSVGYIDPIVFNTIFFSKYYPLSGDINVANRMNSMIFKDLIDVSGAQSYDYLSDSFYGYSSNGFNFWQFNSPLSMGMGLHLNEIFGWEKLDIFMDAQGALYNVYDYDEEFNVFIPTNKRAISWNASVGVGYKVSKGKTVFIKHSVSFKNLTPTDNGTFGGVNMKF